MNWLANDRTVKDDIEKMKKTLIEVTDMKLEDVLKSYRERILKLEEHVKQFETTLASHFKDFTSRSTLPSTAAACSAGSNPTSSKSTPSPFQTQPGLSCCDHICRPDPDDIDYDKCCRHRCRKPWT